MLSVSRNFQAVQPAVRQICLCQRVWHKVEHENFVLSLLQFSPRCIYDALPSRTANNCRWNRRLGNNFRVLASCAYLETILNWICLIPFTLRDLVSWKGNMERSGSGAPQYMLLQISLHIASMVHSWGDLRLRIHPVQNCGDAKMFLPANFHKSYLEHIQRTCWIIATQLIRFFTFRLVKKLHEIQL